MTFLRIAAVVSLLIAGGRFVGSPALVVFTPRCRPVDAESTALAVYLTKLATATDSATVRTRLAYALPAAPSASVVRITDEAICGAAADAFNDALDSSDQVSGRSVHVVQVGNVYYVLDPTAQAGEFTVGMTLDTNYTVLATVAG